MAEHPGITKRISDTVYGETCFQIIQIQRLSPLYFFCNRQMAPGADEGDLSGHFITLQEDRRQVGMFLDHSSCEVNSIF